MTLISLIIPFYNHKAGLPRLLESVVAQSAANECEVLLIDDCSDESCEDVVAAYRTRGLDVRAIRLPERGYTKAARLRGLEEAKGDVIAFADADDTLWGTTALEHNARLLLAEDADIVHFPCVAINGDHAYMGEYEPVRPLASRLQGRAIFSALIRNRVRCPTVWCKLYSRRLARRVIEPARAVRVRRYREDVVLTTLFFLHAERYIGSDMPGYGHRAVDKNTLKAAGRVASCWYMLQDLMPYLERHAVPEHEQNVFRRGLVRLMRDNMQIWCRAALADGYPRPSDHMVADFLNHAQWRDVVAMLRFLAAT